MDRAEDERRSSVYLRHVRDISVTKQETYAAFKLKRAEMAVEERNARPEEEELGWDGAGQNCGLAGGGIGRDWLGRRFGQYQC